MTDINIKHSVNNLRKKQNKNKSNMQLKRIAFLTPIKVNFHGGAETWVKAVSKELSERGFMVDIISPQDTSIPDLNDDKVNEICFNSNIYKIFKRLRVQSSLYPIFLFFKPKKNYDVIYVNNTNAILFYIYYRGKVIIGTHNFFSSNNKFGIDTYLEIIPFFLKFIKKNNIFIHAISNIIQKKFLKSNKKIFTIPPLFPKSFFNNSIATTFTVVFFGKIMDRKGAPLLFQIIELLSTNKNIEIKIIGEVTEKYKSKAAKYNSSENIHFYGYVSEDKKAEILSNACLSLNLSKREAFPNTITEALSYGLPVITTWRPASEIYKGLPVEIYPEDATSIIEGIFKYYDYWKADPHQYAQYKEYNYNNFQKVLNPDQILISTIDMFKKVSKCNLNETKDDYE